MNNQIVTKGIVLSRTNFGEADRILTFLTPRNGKLSVIAKGVRKPKSRLAGGIELFSISDITVLPGRGEIATLTSSRLERHFGSIAADLHRSAAGFELLSISNKITDAMPDRQYFELLAAALALLSNTRLPAASAQTWFYAQLLIIEGHTPSTTKDSVGNTLHQEGRYVFDFQAMAFKPQPNGEFSSEHIKLLRVLTVITGEQVERLIVPAEVLAATLQLLKSIFQFSRS